MKVLQARFLLLVYVCSPEEQLNPTHVMEEPHGKGGGGIAMSLYLYQNKL